MNTTKNIQVLKDGEFKWIDSLVNSGFEPKDVSFYFGFWLRETEGHVDLWMPDEHGFKFMMRLTLTRIGHEADMDLNRAKSTLMDLVDNMIKLEQAA